MSEFSNYRDLKLTLARSRAPPTSRGVLWEVSSAEVFSLCSVSACAATFGS